MVARFHFVVSVFNFNYSKNRCLCTMKEWSEVISEADEAAVSL